MVLRWLLQLLTVSPHPTQETGTETSQPVEFYVCLLSQARTVSHGYPWLESRHGKRTGNGLGSTNLPYYVHKLICVLPDFTSWSYNPIQIYTHAHSYSLSYNESRKYQKITHVFLISSLCKSSPTSFCSSASTCQP